jgi:DEAD/DEAH box helicase domain-containing protein
MFKKVKFNTHENVGWAKISLPEMELHTASFWYLFAEDAAESMGLGNQVFGDGLKALANVLTQVVPLFIMGDPRDFSALPMVRAPLWERPALFIWEHYPGGVGFSAKLFRIYGEVCRAARDLVAQCDCASGCPSCVGPVLEVGESGKSTCQRLLSDMISHSEKEDRS